MIRLNEKTITDSCAFILAEYERNCLDSRMGFGLANHAYDVAFYKLSGISILLVGRCKAHAIPAHYIHLLGLSRDKKSRASRTKSGAARSFVASPDAVGQGANHAN